jgi:hypothetical protein
MTDLENDTPLQLTDRQGVSDGFRVKGDYDPKLAIERKGLVIVELKRNPQEEFEIQFGARAVWRELTRTGSTRIFRGRDDILVRAGRLPADPDRTAD